MFRILPDPLQPHFANNSLLSIYFANALFVITPVLNFVMQTNGLKKKRKKRRETTVFDQLH